MAKRLPALLGRVPDSVYEGLAGPIITSHIDNRMLEGSPSKFSMDVVTDRGALTQCVEVIGALDAEGKVIAEVTCLGG